jgi:predicted 2-oxoglutarate/Fe(II)-dependent dioxygenase YbiX
MNDQKSSQRDFIQQQDFLPAEDCALLIECFERNQERLFRNPQGDPFWDNRYLWITSLPDSENAAKRVMQDARLRVIEALQAYYSEAAVYSDSVQLVKWSPGQSMVPHADNAHPDGSPHAMPWRDYASVIYLNDDYDGGEFYFTESGIEVKPTTGMLMAFTGGMRHFHGVREVRGAARYTMPGWYTRNVAHRDPSSLDEY